MRAIYGGAGLVGVFAVVSSASRPYGPHNCVDVHKPGTSWRGSYVYMLRASIRRTDTAPVQAEEVRQDDPVGNLRPAGE